MWGNMVVGGDVCQWFFVCCVLMVCDVFDGGWWDWVCYKMVFVFFVKCIVVCGQDIVYVVIGKVG